MFAGLGPRSLRILTRTKRFSALAVLSLGLAIALNTIMFSVLDALINPTISMRSPDRLYWLSYLGDYSGRIAPTDKREALVGLKSFEGGAGAVFGSADAMIAQRGSRSAETRVRTVTPNYFALLGNTPLAGRLLSESDASTEPRPIVLSEKLWRQLFPERTKFDTATLVLAEEPRRIVGLLDYAADFPGAYTDIWQLAPASASVSISRSFNLVRLRDTVTLAAAWVELEMLADRFAALTGESRKDTEFRITPAVGEPFRLYRFHFALIGAVLAVLLVACVNLANLQLARGLSRARELATRSALGATRGDIIRQLVTESAWLAGGGLTLGLVLTFWGMQLVTAAMPPSLSDYLVQPQISWRLFVFAGIAALGCLAVVGLIPALKLSRVDIHEIMKSGAGTGTSRRTRRQYGALVIVQIGLALALSVGATLLLRTAAELYRLDVPAHFERVLFGYVRVMPNERAGTIGPSNRVDDRRPVWPIAQEILNGVRAVPEVENAAVAVWHQPAGLTISLADPGGQARELVLGQRFFYQLVSPEFTRVTGLVVHKGRDFAPGEFAEPLVIVDDQTARFLWPGQEPVGKRIKLGRDTARVPWLEVVGVVRHFNFWSPFSRANTEERMASRMGAVFVLGASDTAAVGHGSGLQLVVNARRADDMPKLPTRIRALVASPATGIRVGMLQPWTRMARIDVLRERQNFVAALFATFAALAVAVAALGVYAIVSHSVSQRTREFGVRMALGAAERDIRRSVLLEGNVLALSGIAVGLLLASQTVGLLAGFLRSEEDRFDSPLFGLVALALFGIALLASYIPARRAMRINPTEALRNE